MSVTLELPDGMAVNGAVQDRHRAVLTRDACTFLRDLVRAFRAERDQLLATRGARHAALAGGETLDFLEETRAVREGDWRVAPIPSDLHDRRVEITGPVDRKMVVNALNSGANCFMADFEDSNAPTWSNCVDGQVNLFDAIRRAIDFTHPDTGKRYALNEEVATLLVRPRGLHLDEAHITVDGETIPASLFDFGLYAFHNAAELLRRGSGPYFYLPKLESHREARWWNQVLAWSEARLEIPAGSMKATVLIETLPAAFEMDEILYELREHSAGLNCGRWDYIFSYIKVHAHDPSRVCPDRDQIGMTQAFMRAYTQLVVRTCHRRGVHAMGGMAAQIPIKGDPNANALAIEKVRQDKQREVEDGHDGTWVAHPALVPVAKEIFASVDGNQLQRLREDVRVTRDDLLSPPVGTRTVEALRHNIRVGVQYLEAWLRGNGCVPLYNLMEDAATAEICRAQVWQWVKHRAVLSDGQTVSRALVEDLLRQELDALRAQFGEGRYATHRFEEARALFLEISTGETLTEFLTLPAYERLRNQA